MRKLIPQKRKKAGRLVTAEDQKNYPTPERRAHADRESGMDLYVGSKAEIPRAEVVDPLRIDKMLRAGIITEEQHLWGIQIVTLFTIANRPFLKAMNYGSIDLAQATDRHDMALSKMNAEQQFYEVIAMLKPRRTYRLIRLICFEEMPAIEAARCVGVKRDKATEFVRMAFDRLGEALCKMREKKKDLEQAATVNNP